MIIKKNNKPIRVIGFEKSTITQEGVYWLSSEYLGEIVVITPDDFLGMTDKDEYQYLVFFTLEVEKRKEVISVVEKLNLDCVTFIHPSAVVYKDLTNLNIDEIYKIVGKGSVISAFSSVLLNSKLGNHCLIEAYCLVAHYCTLGDNVILHSGTMIAGKTTIGSNSVFNFKSSALNALNICQDVEVGAISTVTKDITVPGRYIGSIARYVGERTPFNG